MRASHRALYTGLLLVSCQLGGPARAELWGVRFGMTPKQVQTAFRPAGTGGWRSAQGAEVDLLIWQGTGVPSSAAFAFHGGILTALQARFPEPAAEALVRQASDQGLELDRASLPNGGERLTLVVPGCSLDARAKKDWFKD